MIMYGEKKIVDRDFQNTQREGELESQLKLSRLHLVWYRIS